MNYNRKRHPKIIKHWVSSFAGRRAKTFQEIKLSRGEEESLDGRLDYKYLLINCVSELTVERPFGLDNGSLIVHLPPPVAVIIIQF